MSKADILSTPILGRRAVLAGIASAAVIPTAALTATPAADPIFAAIVASREFQQATEHAYARLSDLHREAEQRFGSADEQHELRKDFVESFIGDEDEYTDSYALPLWDHYRAFAETVPTSQAGLLAMLVYADEITQCEPEVLADFGILSTFATAAKSLSKGGAA
jgi:ATP-dependent exoDNAse (exonuclease V) beta subunit